VGGDRKHLKTDISFTPIFPNAHSETGQDVLLRTHHCCCGGSSTVVAKKHHAAAQIYQQHSSTTALHVFRVICVRGNRPGRIISKHDHSGTNQTSSTGA